MNDLIGKTLGNYRIVERIGRGGMATVYRAYQPALERHVAVKVIHQQLVADDEQFLMRFQREAKSVAALRHPNIVQVFDFGVEGDWSYMVMEYVQGTTLKAELNALAVRGEVMPLEEVQRIFQDMASAIEYAHRQGMVHRDIKPANVMLTAKGDVILTDFGVARIVGGAQYTATGAVTGTPAYMSPEQGQGERGDERSDVYALGVVLYEMVTGRVPFDADTPLAVIFKHISDPLPLPRQLNPIIPEAVEQVILKGLAKEPNDRYQTVAEMADALTNAIAMPWASPVADVPPAGVVDDEAVRPEPEVGAVPVTAPKARPEPPPEPQAPPPPTPRRPQGVQLSQRAWQGIALALLLIAIACGLCGLLAGTISTEPTEDVPNPEIADFWISRGCCLGPAFALLFLAYLSFRAVRRKGRAVHYSEMAAALGVALGLLPTLLGLAIVVQPSAVEDRPVASIVFLLPGLFIIGVSGVFWALVAREK